jgi:hypothetical protein
MRRLLVDSTTTAHRQSGALAVAGPPAGHFAPDHQANRDGAVSA